MMIGSTILMKDYPYKIFEHWDAKEGWLTNESRIQPLTFIKKKIYEKLI